LGHYGGGTIVPRRLKAKGNKKIYKLGQKLNKNSI
jgi:hypothetical protein